MNQQTHPHRKRSPINVFRHRQTAVARAKITLEEQAMHEQSARQYPQLALSPGEYVLEEVRRHPIGLVSIWAITALLVLVAFALVPLYSLNEGIFSEATLIPMDSLPSVTGITAVSFFLALLFLLGGVIAAFVYNGNRFYITTESIVQIVQYSLFNTKRQVVNLINVEDVSADQKGILQHLLNYGTLRLSTQGEDTIYHFRFVANPNDVVHKVHDATEIAIQRLEGGDYPATELG